MLLANLMLGIISTSVDKLHTAQTAEKCVDMFVMNVVLLFGKNIFHRLMTLVMKLAILVTTRLI